MARVLETAKSKRDQLQNKNAQLIEKPAKRVTPPNPPKTMQRRPCPGQTPLPLPVTPVILLTRPKRARGK